MAAGNRVGLRSVRFGETTLFVGSTRITLSIAHVLGYGLLTGWFTVLVWNSSLFGGGASSIESFALRALLVAGTALGLLIPSPSREQGAPPQGARLAGEVAVIALTCPLCCVALLAGLPFAASCALWFCSGVGNARLLSLWSQSFTQMFQKTLILCIGGGFVVAGALLLLVVGMNEPSRYWFVLSLPFVSLALFFLTPRHADEAGGAEQYRAMIASHPDGDKYYAREQLLSRLSNVVMGFLVACATSEIFPVGSVAAAVALVASGAFMTVLLLCVRRSLSFEAFGLLLPCATILLLVFAFAPEPLRTLSLAALVFVFSSFSVLNVSKLAWCSRFLDGARRRGFAPSRAASRFAFLAGFVAGFVALALCPVYPPALILVSFALMVVISLVAFTRVYRIRSHDRSEVREVPGVQGEEGRAASAAPAPRECSIEEAVEKLARARGLSGREGDVALLLAKGRNASHIASALYVSTNTVKTHMYNLYGKLGIHSQQELIDLVEECRQTP